MTTIPERENRDLALLLDLSPEGGHQAALDSDGRSEAERRVAGNPQSQRALDELRVMAGALEALGEAFHTQAGTIDIVDEVRDAVSHLKWEALEGNSRPFHALESELDEVARQWSAQVPVVDMVADVTEAARASHMTDLELELSFAPLADVLNALGDDLVAAAPLVDLVDSVMHRASSTTATPANVVPLRARPVAANAVTLPSRPVWFRRACVAAAAALVVTGAWFVYDQKAPMDPATHIARHLDNPDGGVTDAHSNDNGEFREVAPPALTPEVPEVVPEGPEMRPSVRQAAEPVTLQDAINAQERARLSDVDTFEQLASMSADDAAQLLRELDLSLDALIGAAQFLSQEDAAAVLRAAVANNPDDESLRFALAQSLAGDPASALERQGHLEALTAMNSNNTLPNYMLAADYMARGNVEAGMDALSRGAAGAEANAYTLQSMRQREAALLASGMDADVARYLAVSTGGVGEANDLASLRSELLDYGAFYEREGDLDTAQQIYNAVNQLGVQITEGAEMAVLQQAGLETQRDAIYAIQGIAAILQKPENVAMLGETFSVLSESILEVSTYVNAAQSVVNNPQATSTDWSVLIQHILSNGDTDIANLLGR